MRLLTYQENDDLRPACIVGKNAFDISRTLEYYRGAKNASLSPRMMHLASVEEYFSLGAAQKQILVEAVEYTVNNMPPLQDQPRIIHPLDGIHHAPPLPRPGKIVCVAMNYPSAAGGARPDYPVVFLKPHSTLTSDRSPIFLTAACQEVRFEGELAFYIAQTCHNADINQAKECIGGYTIANDIGDSVLEIRSSQWTSGKMFDTFTPVGPFLSTPDEVPDPHNLSIQTFHNDQLVQEANTGEMLFDIFEITSYLSTITTLQPGDLILTGSPKLMHGQPCSIVPLQPGDSLRVVIESLGELNNHVVQGE
jgi:2-keto-4-pentenoate hydratase/2-oxohepta-3-ene-1,7-dioic acid hydratase in catechol pathway